MEAEPQWDAVADVVVVGFGAAGTVAAIEAAESGAAVIALDRWGRGGASARSGGVIYAGGGTPQQIAAGFDDDPERMAAYLALETGGAIGAEALRRFCERSHEDLEWLCSRGVRIPLGFDPKKSVVPTDDETGLYFSGNEKHFSTTEPAIPRGHRVAGRGMTGRDFVAALHATALERGIDVRSRTRLLRLLCDDAGGVEGVEALVLADDRATRAAHTALYRMIDAAGPAFHKIPKSLTGALDAMERRRGRVVRIRARSGVILATGGFSFNSELMGRHAPAYADAMPLGTPGDDGSGIRAAQEIGAAVRLMDRCGASRFIAPPVGFCSGLLVDADGARICDESLYAATISARMAERGSKGWLIIDAQTRREVRGQIKDAPRLRTRGLDQLLTGRASHVVFPRLFGSVNLYANRITAPTIEELAVKCGLDPAALGATVQHYNSVALSGEPDELGKAPDYLRPLSGGPYAAVRCHLDGVIFPAPCITLGGLDVEIGTQLVRREDGTPIDRLHAVGRCAAGIASSSYVSGLSIADCVHSGRNAGMAVTASPTRLRSVPAL